MPGHDPPRIIAVSSSASATAECRGAVLVSGSYGGEYNAWHAAKWGIRGVVLNDAGVGWEGAGIRGLPYLDRIGLAGSHRRRVHLPHRRWRGHARAAASSATSMRRPGRSAASPARRCGNAPSGCGAGRSSPTQPPAIGGGKRYTISEKPGEPKVICLDAAPMLAPEDAGAIAITGSHAALFRGRPDGVISVPAPRRLLQ